jgi:prepilin-type N-terminal cleavage/methylation domain-containing protein
MRYFSTCSLLSSNSLPKFVFKYKRKAFSLIEVIVVFVVIGILLAVVASTAVWLDSKVDTAAAESSLDSVLSAQRESAFAYSAWEPDTTKLNLPNGPTVSLEESTSPTVVSSFIASSGDLFLSVQDGNGACIAWKVLDPLKGGSVIILPVPPDSFCSARSIAAQFIEYTESSGV